MVTLCNGVFLIQKMMNVVVLTHTIDNAGDYLHRYASLRLIRSKIKVCNLREIDRTEASSPENQDALESSDIIFIPGGPSFRHNLIPEICNLPEKYWWKTSLLGSGVKHQQNRPFNEQTRRFLNSSLPVSLRDLATEIVAKETIDSNQIHMTGCPVSNLTPTMILEDFGVDPSPKSPSIDIAVSDGQDYNKGANQIVNHLARLIPNSERILHSHRNSNHQEKQDTVPIGGDHEKLINVYRNCRVHIGFRVHAHLVCLALGVPTILIVEDESGASLARQYGCTTIDLRSPLFVLKILNRIGLAPLSGLIAKQQALRISRKFKDVPEKIQTHSVVDPLWDDYFSNVSNVLKQRQIDSVT